MTVVEYNLIIDGNDITVVENNMTVVENYMIVDGNDNIYTLVENDMTVDENDRIVECYGITVFENGMIDVEIASRRHGIVDLKVDLFLSI